MLRIVNSIVFALWVVCLISAILIELIIKPYKKYKRRKMLYKIFSCFYDIANLSIYIDQQIPLPLCRDKIILPRHFISEYLQNGDDKSGHFCVKLDNNHVFEFLIRIKNNTINRSTLNVKNNNHDTEVFDFGDCSKTRVVFDNIKDLKMLSNTLNCMRNMIYMSILDKYYAKKFSSEIEIYDIIWKNMSHSEIKREAEYEC